MTDMLIYMIFIGSHKLLVKIGYTVGLRSLEIVI